MLKKTTWGSKSVIAVMSAARPLFPQEQTFVGTHRMVASCRYCSLIPGFGVTLSAIILAGPTVLSAVGACPPHDGVRRRWWINVASAVSLIESSQKIGRSHHRHRPGRDILSRRAAGIFHLVMARYAATSFFAQSNSVRS